MVGETVIAIGNPRGNANSVTTGVLSAQERTIRVRAPDGNVRGFNALQRESGKPLSEEYTDNLREQSYNFV